MTEQEKKFTEKADKYVVCFNTSCPLHEHCLRWRLTSYITGQNMTVTSINPNHPDVGTSKCTMYRSDKPVRMPVGLLYIYHDMPGRTEFSIKNTLINKYSRKRYYEYHNGTRPIPPDVEAYIRQVCRANNWTAELTFGGYIEEYLW